MSTAPAIVDPDDVGAAVPAPDTPADATNAAGVPGAGHPLPVVCAAPVRGAGGPAYLHRSLCSAQGALLIGRTLPLPKPEGDPCP